MKQTDCLQEMKLKVMTWEQQINSHTALQMEGAHHSEET